MDFPWYAENYKDIVNFFLGYRQKRRPRGVVKKLADRLSCHPTFISQVLNNHSDFSLEQGYEISDYFMFSYEQRDYFLTLVLKDRAGNKKLRQYYQEKIETILETKRDLSPKSQPEVNSLGSLEFEYYSQWIYQLTHALTQIDSLQTLPALTKFLGFTSEEVSFILSRLETMGLLKKENNRWVSGKNFMHLSKSSILIRQLHSTWKNKILSDLQTQTNLEGTRYSGVITVTEKDYQKIRDILTDAINQIRKKVEDSTSEVPCLLSLDLYKILNTTNK